MSINQRIKTLRKKLNLIQQDFAKKIGVQRVTISWMEKEGNTITRQNVKIICDAFNVNEHWLRTGEGDMFKPVDEPNILDRLQRELNLNNAEMEIIKTFLDIPRVSEATTVSHSDTSAQQVSFPDSDHVAESKAFLSGSCRKLRPARWHLR